MLTPVQLYFLALVVGFYPGFSPDTGSAGTMAALAMRESGGRTDLVQVSEWEQSYGPWQINALVPGRLHSLGLTTTQLKDPWNNAWAAKRIWAWDDRNLNIAWYTGRGRHRKAYLANLVVVQAMVNAQRIEVPGLGSRIVPVPSSVLDLVTGK